MIEAGILALLLGALYVGLARYNASKNQKARDELEDEARANEILTRSINRDPERVRKLDDAGFRD